LWLPSAPDPKKGRAVVVLYTELKQSAPSKICRALQSTGSAAAVDPLARQLSPRGRHSVLGTGKLDLKHVKDVALAEFA